MKYVVKDEKIIRTIIGHCPIPQHDNYELETIDASWKLCEKCKIKWFIEKINRLETKIYDEWIKNIEILKNYPEITQFKKINELNSDEKDKWEQWENREKIRREIESMSYCTFCGKNISGRPIQFQEGYYHWKCYKKVLN